MSYALTRHNGEKNSLLSANPLPYLQFNDRKNGINSGFPLIPKSPPENFYLPGITVEEEEEKEMEGTRDLFTHCLYRGTINPQLYQDLYFMDQIVLTPEISLRLLGNRGL